MTRFLLTLLQVDTHIHLAAAMNQKHLLRFIKKKCKTEPHTIVSRTQAKDGSGVMEMTLAQVWAEDRPRKGENRVCERSARWSRIPSCRGRRLRMEAGW
jgi:hypothetical protein